MSLPFLSARFSSMPAPADPGPEASATKRGAYVAKKFAKAAGESYLHHQQKRQSQSRSPIAVNSDTKRKTLLGG